MSSWIGGEGGGGSLARTVLAVSGPSLVVYMVNGQGAVSPNSASPGSERLKAPA